MGRNNQRRPRCRRNNDDINGNNRLCDDRNDHLQQNGKKAPKHKDQFGTKQLDTAARRKDETAQKSAGKLLSSRNVGGLCFLLVLLTFCFHTRLESLLHEVLHKSTENSKYKQTSAQYQTESSAEKSQSPAATSIKTHSRLAKRTGKNI